MFKHRKPCESKLIRSVAIIICLASFPVLTVQAQPDDLEATSQRVFDIPAQDLAPALALFARQNGGELLYSPEIAAGHSAPAVIGQMTGAEAMSRLLSGTGLDFVETATGGFMVGEQAVLDDYRRRMRGEAGLADVATAEPEIDISRYAGIEEVIVTGQKREERMQDVPISISAFSMDSLDQQKIEGGFDLLKAVPNVTFSKTNFTGYNFQIRGIGTQAISATTDPGVAMSQNNTTLIVNRLFEQEYLDIERVEVLRGPQGTLYGRNATAGVINVITAKPKIGVWEGELKLEGGNYSAQRLRGHLNIPLFDSDSFAARIAYASTQRDGYGTNLAEGGSYIGREAPSSQDLDSRDLWTARFSLGWQPSERFRANLIFERFEEDDHRLRTSKQLCHRDPGDNVAGEPLREIRDLTATQFRVVSSQLSQGCLAGSLFATGNPNDPNDNGAFGVPHSDSYPFIRGARGYASVITPTNEDLLAGGGVQSQNLRTIFTLIKPEYRANSDLVELSLDVELTDALTVSSQTVYMENSVFSTQDFLRFESRPGVFIDSSTYTSPSSAVEHMERYIRGVTPGGVFHDPQIGPSDRMLMQDISQQSTRQLSQELRLVSNFAGPVNFSLGANYTRFDNTADYFVFANALSLLAVSSTAANQSLPVPFDPVTGLRLPDDILESGEAGVDYVLGMKSGFVRDGASGGSLGCGTRFDHSMIVRDAGGEILGASCIYMQRDGLHATAENPEGHNFFLSRNPYALRSASLFGEAYIELLPTLKLTAGARLNWDRKTFTPVPSQTLLADWRGRFQGGFLGQAPGTTPQLGNEPTSMAVCDPRVSTVVGSTRVVCGTSGLGVNGRGYPALPDIVQEWRVPTGRIGVDWKPELGLGWVDESLLYAFYTRGYKAGGANPPGVSPPQGILMAAAQGAEALPTFRPEYVNAFELGLKSTLFHNLMTLNVSGFYYDYSDYQVSKIVDRSAANENFDATIWGLELETLFAPGVNTLLNASIGYLRTRIADDQRSLDLMDRTQGGGADYWLDRDGNRHELRWDEWVVIKPNFLQASNCVAPAALVRDTVLNQNGVESLAYFCPGGRIFSETRPTGFDPFTDTPNGGAGFFAEVGGNELPNAPRFTVSLGAQHTLVFRRSAWSATGRVDWYWQDKSFHRIYNTEYDRLKDWTNTNLSFWLENERHQLTLEVYVKNVFDETPVTGAFLNSDDTGLSTNVFTLDPRLVGLSIRKRF